MVETRPPVLKLLAPWAENIAFGAILQLLLFDCFESKCVAPSAVETHRNQQPNFENNKLQVIQFDWSHHEPGCL